MDTTRYLLERTYGLSSGMGVATPERCGSRQRIYVLSADGKARLNEVMGLRAHRWNQVSSFDLKFSHG